jgi:hypothetical protein
MGITVANSSPSSYPNESFGSVRCRCVTATMDSSYPTGGESLTAVELGFPVGSTILLVLATPASGYLPEYDYTNNKLKVLTPIKSYAVTHDAASINAETSADQTLTVTGVGATDQAIGIQGPAAMTARGAFQSTRVTAANEVTARITNFGDDAVDTASGSYLIHTTGANGSALEIPDTTSLTGIAFRVIAFAR